MQYNSFEELNVYKNAILLRQEMRKLALTFPPEEKYQLTDQLIRSTRKCPAQIAEGHGRYHHQENIQYCRIARGSLYETIDHLICAKECVYITNEYLEIKKGQITTLIKMINGYIRFLNNEKKK